MSDKLVKSLNKEREQREKLISGDKIVGDAKQLLLDSSKRDDKILKTLGLDHQITYTKKLQEDVQRTKAVSKIYNQVVFSKEDLHKLCNKYSLKVLPSHYYNGSIPPELSRKIEEFCEKNDIPVLGSKFFIMAPEEQFNTIKQVPIQADPILFYSPEYNGHSLASSDTFIQVHNWGNDFGFLRRFRWMRSSYTYRSDHTSTSGYMVGVFIAVIMGLPLNIFLPSFWYLTFPTNFLMSVVVMLSYASALEYKNEYLDNQRFSTINTYSNQSNN